jgi:hypothetical protein
MDKSLTLAAIEEDPFNSLLGKDRLFVDGMKVWRK